MCEKAITLHAQITKTTMKHFITALAAMLLMGQPTLFASDEKHDEHPAVELKHDRTVIYPQRMKLNGVATINV